ncbi:MAG: nucleoside triphosphate pyrophosphohydrolase [Gammaproteobacteria bacterium]|nr:nucleoside triphosphate pyrophosphohydrolase [Gammaproteobacteria bacterium]
MSAIEHLLEIMRRLRDPQAGCPWDREQTYRSLAPHTLEEAYEVADAIEQDDLDHLPDELGDLLFQVVFYAQIGQEEGRFNFEDVAQGISDKLVRRHPHVFADAAIDSAEEQTQAWEEHKRQERDRKATNGQASALEGVSLALPALVRAAKLQRRAARVGFDWPDVEGVIAKVREELAELESELQVDAAPERLAEELGDLLFSCVNLARHLKVDPEAVLRTANLKFEQRFRHMEAVLQASGGIEQASLQEMDAAWEAVKLQEKSPLESG